MLTVLGMMEQGMMEETAGAEDVVEGVDWGVFRKIFISWFVTVPIGAVGAGLLTLAFKWTITD